MMLQNVSVSAIKKGLKDLTAFREFQKLLGKKDPPKPATREEIEQLKLELEKVKLETAIQKEKQSLPNKPNKGLKFLKLMLSDAPTKRKAPKL